MKQARCFVPVCMLLLTGAFLVGACGPTEPAEPPSPPDALPGDPAPTPTPADSEIQPETEPSPEVDSALFAGKTVTLLVGFAPGGGYDTFARMAAQLLPEYLPGEPRVVVRNLPGGGGLGAVREAQRAAPDGLTANIIHSRWMRRDLLGVDVPDFSIENTTWIGALGGIPTTSALYARRDLATSWEEIEALGRTVSSGATEPGATGNMGAWFIELTGGPIETLYGYGGTAEIAAAFDRGEIDITYVANPQIAPRLFPEWGEEQLVAPLFYWSTPPEEDEQFMEWMDTLGTSPPPHLYDVVETEEWQRTTFDLVVRVGDITSRAFHLPPGVSDEVKTAWRDTMRGVAEDPRFEELGVAAGYNTGYTNPEEMEQALLQARENLTDERVYNLFSELSGGED